jgi:hypothetical protein
MRAWFVLGAIGCGGGGGDTGNCPGFATIRDGTFTREGTTLTWTLEVAELPAQLDFDREGIPNFVLEYGWMIELDSNNDGEPDWEVAAKHFKMDRAPVTAAILDVAQVDLWLEFGAGGSIAGSADARISGNTFTFVVDEDEDPDLVNIVNPKQSSYTTFHQLGSSILDQCSDRL